MLSRDTFAVGFRIAEKAPVAMMMKRKFSLLFVLIIFTLCTFAKAISEGRGRIIMWLELLTSPTKGPISRPMYYNWGEDVDSDDAVTFLGPQRPLGTPLLVCSPTRKMSLSCIQICRGNKDINIPSGCQMCQMKKKTITKIHKYKKKVLERPNGQHVLYLLKAGVKDI